jgi:hypothetical protein
MSDEPQNLTEKELLIEINRQLAHIREQLGDDLDRQTKRYECHICHAEVSADERQSHLENKHNAPPAIAFEEQYIEL